MEASPEKSSLRKVLAARRDALSFDYISIASKQIHENLKNMKIYQDAKIIASYFPIGSEVRTQDIMQEILSLGKTLLLPKVIDGDLSFRKIRDFDELEKTSFSIMEPKDRCLPSNEIDMILVPTVGITRNGIRLGYGYGFYDRFLAKSKAETVSLTYSKQIVKSIPFSKNDIKINWIVTENEYFKTSKVA